MSNHSPCPWSLSCRALSLLLGPKSLQNVGSSQHDGAAFLVDESPLYHTHTFSSAVSLRTTGQLTALSLFLPAPLLLAPDTPFQRWLPLYTVFPSEECLPGFPPRALLDIHLFTQQIFTQSLQPAWQRYGTRYGGELKARCRLQARGSVRRNRPRLTRSFSKHQLTACGTPRSWPPVRATRRQGKKQHMLYARLVQKVP